TFLSGREVLSSDFDHGMCHFEPVVDHVDLDLDFVLYSVEILFGFGDLVLALPYEGSPLAAVEDILSEVNPKRPQVAIEERNSVLIAIATEGGDVGNVLGLGRRMSGACFGKRLFSFFDFRVFLNCSLKRYFAQR